MNTLRLFSFPLVVLIILGPILYPGMKVYGYEDETQSKTKDIATEPASLNLHGPRSAAINRLEVDEVLARGILPIMTLATQSNPTLTGGSALTVLWNQPLSTTYTEAYIDMIISDDPEYSSFLSDDFIVDRPWLINTFFIPGDLWLDRTTTLADADGLTFMIYADKAGIPAGDPLSGGDLPIWTLTVIPTDSRVTLSIGSSGYYSNITLALITPLLLVPGHYWLVYFPTLSFDEDGQFGLQPSDTSNQYTAQFINPGNGFQLGTTWQPWTNLDPGLLTQTDIAFRLEGTFAYSVYLPAIIR